MVQGSLRYAQAADADAYFDEVQEVASTTGNEIDELLPTTVSVDAVITVFPHLNIALQRSHLKPIKPSRRRVQRIIQKRDWAHVIDVNTPLSNFHELVPEMAHKVFHFSSLESV